MKISHRILKYVKIDVRKVNLIVNLRSIRMIWWHFGLLGKRWRAILTVNLRGIRMIWGHFGVLGKALESHFECEFTWYPHDLGACLGAWTSTGDAF